MNIFLFLIILFLFLSWLLDFISDKLNIKNMTDVLPEEFAGYYDEEKYKKSQNYLKDKTKFSTISSTIILVVEIVFIIFAGFNYVDVFARSFNFNQIGSGLIFITVLLVLMNIIQIPFSAYNTFVIEEKYGFNKTTVKTFVLDIIKSFVLTLVIGLPVFALIIWFFVKFSNYAWLYVAVSVMLIELLITFIAPVFIMPLFNKYTPLEDGELKTELEKICKRTKF